MHTAPLHWILQTTYLTSEVRHPKQLGPESAGDVLDLYSLADRRSEAPSSQLLLEQLSDAEELWPSCRAYQSG